MNQKYITQAAAAIEEATGLSAALILKHYRYPMNGFTIMRRLERLEYRKFSGALMIELDQMDVLCRQFERADMTQTAKSSSDSPASTS